jgi:hypothetical protein
VRICKPFLVNGIKALHVDLLVNVDGQRSGVSKTLKDIPALGYQMHPPSISDLERFKPVTRHPAGPAAASGERIALPQASLLSRRWTAQ